ncbi:follicle cell protein 3C-1 [Drosophila sulfurigaster albostrigata]|uniref:follicle cell protein 3C-1 n=1 Tax=Drosophila sulfurigaster albostrigata TaxID=89887 RepID=UPI002D219841|nr:follicle cell protein 3C-1 [Drosophila sulfurigaster albostrigata]
MACNTTTRLMTVLLVLLAAIALEQHVAASKFAYKKPIYGKTSYVKDRRYKMRTTSSPDTTEDDWPAPVEFIINSTPRSTGTSRSTTESSISSTPSPATSTTEMPGSTRTVATSTDSTSSCSSSSTSTTESGLDNTLPSPPTPGAIVAAAVPLNQPVPCTCGVFLSSQIKNGLPDTPLIHNEMDRMYPCNAIGHKQCQTKCLEAIVQHLPNSANIVCATLGHNCHKERAYLFIKNCHNQWVNTNLQAGREYCCKEGVPYRCPLLG